MQTFKVQPVADGRGRCVPMTAVQLHVTDNWGQTEYTCLYRFRVHPAEDLQAGAAVGAAH